MLVLFNFSYKDPFFIFKNIAANTSSEHLPDITFSASLKEPTLADDEVVSLL